MPKAKIFISYSHDSESHIAWVEMLAEEISKAGLDVYLDRWSVQKSPNLDAFMDEAKSTDWIIPVISNGYRQKYESTETSGVAYEAKIINRRIRDYPTAPRVRPIIRGNDNPPERPKALKKLHYLDFEDDSKFHTQLLTLIDLLQHGQRRVFDSIGDHLSEASLRLCLSGRVRLVKEHLYLASAAQENTEGLYTFAVTPELVRISGYINAVAFRNQRWAGSSSSLQLNVREKVLRNGLHAQQNPLSICLLRSRYANHPPLAEDFIGMTHFLPVSEGAFSEYLSGGVRDNEFLPELIACTGERTSSFLLFSIAFDEAARQRMYSELPDGDAQITQTCHDIARMLAYHARLVVSSHCSPGVATLYCQRGEDSRVWKWMRRLGFQPLVRDGQIARSADGEEIHSISISCLP